jgi:hypothetical protein
VSKQYPQAPEMTIDTAKSYTATIKTVRGDFTMRLRPDLAPQHVNSFVFLQGLLRRRHLPPRPPGLRRPDGRPDGLRVWGSRLHDPGRIHHRGSLRAR